MSIKRWLDNSWLSCRRFSERASKALDVTLSGADKAGYIFHYYFCPNCRRFYRQLHTLDRGLRSLAVHLEEGEAEILPNESLSKEKKEEILKEISEI